MDTSFHSSFGLTLSITQVVQTLVDFMRADETANYKITIGSDSERRADGSADFVTAIVIHRVGNGGRYFFRRALIGKKFHTLRDRIYEEVLLSLATAKELVETVKALSLPWFSAEGGPASGWDFEIHVDVGENGETRAMIQELVGMVRAHNFAAKTKPESYAASKVADRHV